MIQSITIQKDQRGNYPLNFVKLHTRVSILSSEGKNKQPTQPVTLKTIIAYGQAKQAHPSLLTMPLEDE